MRGLVGTLEKHHKVRILDEAVSEAVRLSARYIPARQLPDKAVSLIDTACARVAMSQAATRRRSRIASAASTLVETERGILRARDRPRRDHAERRDALDGRSSASRPRELAALDASAGSRRRALATADRRRRARRSKAAPTPATRTALRATARPRCAANCTRCRASSR